MNSLELVDSFSEFKELKNIDKQTMQRVLEDVFRAMLKKKFNSDEHIDIVVNIDKGDVQIFLNKEIVDDGEVEDPNTEIAYSDAIKIEPDFEIGEEVTEEFKFGDFGRRNVLSLRQNLISRIMELEKDNLYKIYKEKNWRNRYRRSLPSLEERNYGFGRRRQRVAIAKIGANSFRLFQKRRINSFCGSKSGYAKCKSSYYLV